MLEKKQIAYEKAVLIGLINKDQDEINNHILMIENEIKNTEKISRMKELENWINYLYEN